VRPKEESAHEQLDEKSTLALHSQDQQKSPAAPQCTVCTNGRRLDDAGLVTSQEHSLLGEAEAHRAIMTGARAPQTSVARR
jgi:hypothetical protein